MDYIAPEQAEDAAKVDARTDIYSLGCSLYFGLTGRPPFPGGSMLEKIVRHRTVEPIPVQKLNPSVPDAFAQFLRRLMAKKREDRPASCDAVRSELLKWATGEPDRPMDIEGDSNYRRAIRQLETRTDWSELTADLVPIPSNGPRRRGRVHNFAFHRLGEAPEVDSPRGITLLLLEIAGLVLVGSGLVFMLYLASR
jgi:serine/threonine protein kinase